MMPGLPRSEMLQPSSPWQKSAPGQNDHFAVCVDLLSGYPDDQLGLCDAFWGFAARSSFGGLGVFGKGVLLPRAARV